jgi:uncharacterized Zn finger protein
MDHQKEKLNFKKVLEEKYSEKTTQKVRSYIDKFSDREFLGNKIRAKTEGNYGVYTVVIEKKYSMITSSCVCYIGKNGGCHHCAALAHTYINNYDSFDTIEKYTPKKIQNLDMLNSYIQSVTLSELLSQLKQKGISQKAFAESLNMSTAHLGSIKRCEERQHYYHELGVTKLACLWLLQNNVVDGNKKVVIKKSKKK